MTEPHDDEPAAGRERTGLSRRSLLFGTGVGVLAGAAVGAAGTAAVTSRSPDASRSPDPSRSPDQGAPVPAVGEHQAGIARPALPQQHCLVVVGDIDRTSTAASLTALSAAIRTVTDAAAPDLAVTPDGPGDLTVTVGLGARPLADLDPTLAGAVALPVFAGDDDLDPDRRGGDILLSVNATDPVVLEPVMTHLQAAVAGFRTRWSDFGYLGMRDGDVSRNPFGYYDGIIVPRGDAELDANVWIAEGPLAGGTICVIRRFRLDTAGFGALAPDRQDAIIGRHRTDGSPLSGGTRGDDVDLLAKTPEGQPLIPTHAHARAAHPSFTGSDLMLRRSYNYRASADDHGHLFISYQRDVTTFSRTQLRLDETDDLMAFSTPTATAAFAILPGMTGDHPLGLATA